MYQPNLQTLLKIKITRNVNDPVSFATLPYGQRTVPVISVNAQENCNAKFSSSLKRFPESWSEERVKRKAPSPPQQVPVQRDSGTGPEHPLCASGGTLTESTQRTVTDVAAATRGSVITHREDKPKKSTKRGNNKIEAKSQETSAAAMRGRVTSDNKVSEKFQNVIGIDIGEFNTALTILQNNIVTGTFHYSMTNNKKDASFRKNLNHILYEMLDESIFAHFDNTSLLVKIEDQLPMNRKALVVQTTIQTILYMKGYHVERVLPRQKYKSLKTALGITKCPAKTALVKYFEVDKAHVSYRVYNSSIGKFEDNKNGVNKCDDIIDSYLIATV